jgi:hypothetical protein
MSDVNPISVEQLDPKDGLPLDSREAIHTRMEGE